MELSSHNREANLVWHQYGKLSDVYGRRALLIVAYAFFAAGCALVGVGQSMGQVILGRVVSGCGGTGMNVLAMLIISGE